MHCLTLIIIESLALSVLCEFAFSVTKNVNIALGICCVAIVLPQLPGYYDFAPLREWLSYLPTSYASIPFITGFPAYFNGTDITSINGLSLARAYLVFTVTIPVLVLCCCATWMHPSGGTHAAGERLCLSASELNLGFKGHALLSSAHLELLPGAVVGLVAPNGAGKTTLLRLLVNGNSGNLRGVVQANGLRPESAAYHKIVFFVPGDASSLYPNLTAVDHVRMATRLWDGDRDPNEIIALMGMKDYAARPCRALSQGMRQQVLLACAYATNARYLLLDEPMNALDPGNVRSNTRLLRQLAKDGAGILLSSHILSNVDDLCDVVLLITGKSIKGVELGAGGKTTGQLYEEAYG